MMSKVTTAKGGLNLSSNKPRLAQQNLSVDPHKLSPLAFIETWLGKELCISFSMEDEVIFICNVHTHTHTFKWTV